MNVSTVGIHLQLTSRLQSLQRSILDAQKEISTGRKADLMAALREGTARAVDLRNALNEATEFKSTADLVGSRLDTMQNVLASVKEAVDGVRTAAMTATSSVSRRQLSELAKSAIDQITAFLNTSVDGRALFSGTASDTSPLQTANAVNAATGLSPSDAVAQIIANLGPITDAASAQAIATGPDGIQSLFDDSNSDADLRFSSTFYNGAASGTVTARLDRGYELDYGIRADDPAIREALQGLYMLAAAPSDSVPEDGYAAWQQEATGHLLGGFQAIINLQSNLGYKQEAVSKAGIRQESVITQLQTQVADLESADPYETATRLSELQNQLEATFSITARLSQLHLTNYLT